MNWIMLMLTLGRKPVCLAPAGDEGSGAGDDNQEPIDDEIEDDDEIGDDDADDDDPDDADDDDDADDENDDEGDEDDEGKQGKGAQKRIRQLVDERNSLKRRVSELEKLSGDDGKAILASAEATGILPQLMNKGEAEAFERMKDLPTIIDRYQDWLDDHDKEDELEIGEGRTMSYGDVKKRVRRLRTELDGLKDTYGERHKELTAKVREIFETGKAALEAGWKPDGKKKAAKAAGKKPKADRPSGRTPSLMPRHRATTRPEDIEVTNEDDLEAFIAAENRQERKRRK